MVDDAMSGQASPQKKTYTPPMLIRLQDDEPESGTANVPETDNGLLS